MDTKSKTQIGDRKMEINKESLIKAGGKLWEKENIERVYLNDSVLEMMGFKIVKSLSGIDQKIQSVKKHKLYFDCKLNELKCDKGMIRTQLNTWGYNCSN